MNELQIFKNEQFGQVRVIEIDGEPWFVAVDVCKALSISNSRDALSSLDDDEKGVALTDTLGGKQNMSVVNEFGLYSLVLRSRKREAVAFKRWITHEVIPSIRKTGGYNLPQTYAEALRALADKAEEAERLALENEEMRPKAEFFDTVADSKTAISMNEVAKVIDRRGYGRNNLFEFLRDNKVLDDRNVPYQRYVDAGWFRVIEQHYQRDGEPMVSTKTLVYQRGVDAIRKLLDKKGKSK